jgi:SAM-dependent methyltransferase
MTTWQFPEPVQDLEAWRVTNMEWFDPSHAHRLFWPDRPYRAEIDILSAGSGPNQAAALALTNPAARVVGIDTDQEAVDHLRLLKDRYGLTNLEVHLLPVDEVGSLGRTFDLAICSRSLNYAADPAAQMTALARVLNPDGVAAIMLFARYGRLGVAMMQSAFDQMGLRADEESLRLARTGLNWLNPAHPARVYASMAPDLASDAGIVGTFLRGGEHSYTVQDSLDLVEGAGLVLQDWFLKTPMYPAAVLDPDNEFLAAVNALPQRQMWPVMELLINVNVSHMLIACRPDRPERTYRIDFASPEAPEYVPGWRSYAGVDGERIFRIGGAFQPAPQHRALAELIDGARTVGEIAGATGTGIAEAAAFFEQLWRLDFLTVALR